MVKATIYTTDWCGYCRAAKRFLEGKGVPVEEIDVTDDDDGREALARKTGRTTVPQIWIGETWVGGYDDLRALDARGGLAPLLDRV